MDMSEDQVLEERYPYLDDDGGIRITDIMEEHWGGVAEDYEDRSKIHALRWYVYKNIMRIL